MGKSRCKIRVRILSPVREIEVIAVPVVMVDSEHVIVAVRGERIRYRSGQGVVTSCPRRRWRWQKGQVRTDNRADASSWNDVAGELLSSSKPRWESVLASN